MPERSLLLFNLRTDADDSVLGFTTDWINALAATYDHVDVITMHAGRLAVAPNVNVYSAGRECGYSDAWRALRFYWLLVGLLLRRRYVACFAHMMPLFALMGAPLLALWRVRCVLWYTHRQRTRQLAWATRLVWRVVSATETSFPIATPKLRVLGHGIRTDFFMPPPAYTPQSPPLVVYVARLTPIKRQALLIEAAGGLNCQLALIGDVPDGFDAAYAADLRAQAGAGGQAEQVLFLGKQPPETVREWLWRAHISVNLAPPGLFDKAALEAMACGVPTLVTNAAFAPILGDHAANLLLPDEPTPAALHAALARWLAASNDDRLAVGAALRAGVEAHHSLPALIQQLNALFLGE
jgi:glycosyltransferase involved in cell wall biosynthesis